MPHIENGYGPQDTCLLCTQLILWHMVPKDRSCTVNPFAFRSGHWWSWPLALISLTHRNCWYFNATGRHYLAFRACRFICQMLYNSFLVYHFSLPLREKIRWSILGPFPCLPLLIFLSWLKTCKSPSCFFCHIYWIRESTKINNWLPAFPIPLLSGLGIGERGLIWQVGKQTLV